MAGRCPTLSVATALSKKKSKYCFGAMDAVEKELYSVATMHHHPQDGDLMGAG